MVIVGRDQTRHYYYNCCTILQPPPPTTAKNPTAFWGQNGRLSPTGVGACACAPKSSRRPSCCTPAGTVFESPSRALAGPPPTRCVRSSIALSAFGACAAAFNTSRERGGGGERDSRRWTGWSTPRTRCARWSVASVMRHVCVCTFVRFGKSVAPHWGMHARQTRAHQGSPTGFGVAAVAPTKLSDPATPPSAPPHQTPKTEIQHFVDIAHFC